MASDEQVVRTVEDRLGEWSKQPGAVVTDAQRQFIADMRSARESGVGYGWMQQIIEWEWQNKAPGSWGPEYFRAEIAAAHAEGRREMREEAARVADKHRTKVAVNEPLWHDGQDWAAQRIGEAIRALPETEP